MSEHAERLNKHADVWEKIGTTHAAFADARLVSDLREAAAALSRADSSHDANVERLKACEHIAEGDEGWEVLADICPSTAAVATLRAALSRAEADAESERLRNGSTHWHARANTWFKRHQIVSARATKAEAQRDALAKALTACQRGPVMPPPDPQAHSWRAWGEFWRNHWLACRDTAQRALAAAADIQDEKGERDNEKGR